MVSSIVQGLYQRLMSLLDNQHSSSLAYQPCFKSLNQVKKSINTRFSIRNDEEIFQICLNPSRSQIKAAILSRHDPETHCIISSWLMRSPPCGPSGSNHMYCLLVAFNRHHSNLYCVQPNVFCIVVTTEKLIVIDVVCEVGTSLETTSHVILQLPFWHSTPLSQVIKGLDFWLWDFHHSLDRCFVLRYLIVPRWVCSVGIQLLILKNRLAGCGAPNPESSLMMIRLLLRLVTIHHHSFREFRSCI